jgi:hypothetical protein
MLLAGIKPAIRQTIKARINEDNKNAADPWTAMETEYRIHAADIRMDLCADSQQSLRAATSNNIYLNSEIYVASSSRWGLRYPNGNRLTSLSMASKATKQESSNQNGTRAETPNRRENHGARS